MTRLQKISTTLLLSGASFLSVSALAQQPPAATSPKTKVAATTPSKTPNSRRSIVHHYRYPYPGHYQGDRAAGFRNPGGVGRYAEYYPAGDQFENSDQDPVRVAHFDTGGGQPNRAEQLQAQQIGIQRQNSIQSHIDNYSRPYLGYGVGFFGGYY